MRSSAGDPALLPAHILSIEIGARRLSPVDLVDALLARIRAGAPKLHAFVEVYAEDARLAAEAADKAIRSGHAIGPLHGIPIALKDLVEIEGKVTTGGSLVWRPVVDSNRHAGAAPDRRRADRDRQDAYGRVRNGGLGHQPAPGHTVESLGPRNGAHTRRVERRLGRCGCGRLSALGGRHRYRRLSAVASVLVRAQRPQDDDRAGQHLWDFAAEPDP